MSPSQRRARSAGRKARGPREREIPVGHDARWREAIDCWDRRLDSDAAQRAVEAFEEIARAEASDPNALAWCARSRFYLGDYEPDEATRRAHFEAAMKFGRQGVARDRDHIPALFWTAVCAASYAELIGVVRRIAHVPEIADCLKRVWDREPGYYQRGCVRLIGQALVRQPGLVRKALAVALPSAGPDLVMRELRLSIVEDAPLVLTHQTLAQVAWATRKDRATVRKAIQAIEQLDPNATPGFAPENHWDRPRALEILRALLS